MSDYACACGLFMSMHLCLCVVVITILICFVIMSLYAIVVTCACGCNMSCAARACVSAGMRIHVGIMRWMQGPRPGCERMHGCTPSTSVSCTGVAHGGGNIRSPRPCVGVHKQCTIAGPCDWFTAQHPQCTILTTSPRS